ncbi:hypothetical protein AVEN_28606-1 [Araneus ventricosus]|uniref:Uncharacterized protein n=1 Tax=Araneus ventricosus TaxID=182803 RepID=A0A4Y2DDL3_ARAVE|nr:hypothetical protein AVEN_28606-1 [Araneus ventricosus]
MTLVSRKFYLKNQFLKAEACLHNEFCRLVNNVKDNVSKDLHEEGPLWPHGKASSSERRGAPGLKPDSTEDPPCLWAWCTLNLMWAKRSSAGVVLERQRASSGVVI